MTFFRKLVIAGLASVIVVAPSRLALMSSARASESSAQPITVRPATPTERKIFASFAPPGTAAWSLDENAIAGGYALIGFYSDHSGVTALLRYKNGHWVVVERTGGQLTAADIERKLPSIGSARAQAMYDLAASQANAGAPRT